MEHQPGSLGEELGELSAGEPSASSFARVASQTASSARAAGAQAVVSGRWLAEVAVDVATHVPIRDLPTLEAQLGATGEALADRLVRNAARASAGLGAVAGAVVGAEQLAPPAWLLIPVELVVETLLVAGLEMKLLAELQEVEGTPVTGTLAERGAALARAWAEQRGVRSTDVLAGKGLDLVSRGARQQLVKSLQRRMLRRLGRSLGAAIPMMAGAVVGAELNRRATVDFAQKVRADLRQR